MQYKTANNRTRTKRKSRRRVKSLKRNRSRLKNASEYFDKRLEIRTSKYGNGIFATADIPKGTIVVREKPKMLESESGFLDFQSKYFALIEMLQRNHPAEFDNLVPTQEDQNIMEFKKNNGDRIRQICLERNIPFDKGVILFHKIKRNAFNFNNRTAILFFATKFNHSCSPHLTYSPNGEYMEFTCLKDIRKGEEVFDSYINYNMPYADRRERLKRVYGFDCNCVMCSNQK